jgi:hypothetical protein
MPYISGFGPAKFTITIGGVTLNLCIKLKSVATPPDGNYTMSWSQQVNGACSGTNMQDHGTVTLDTSGNITGVTFTRGLGTRTFTGMSGSFSGTTGSGSITDSNSPEADVGTWVADTSMPGEKKHRHSA